MPEEKATVVRKVFQVVYKQEILFLLFHYYAIYKHLH